MPNSTLQEYIQSLLVKGQQAEAVEQVHAIIEHLPAEVVQEQIRNMLAVQPILWEAVLESLGVALAQLNFVLIIGNDNIAIQNTYSSTIQVIKLVVPRPLAHHLNPIPSINPATDCIGRESELAELDEQLNTSNKVALVRGLGGIGKTTLAQAYVALHQGQYQHLLWITQGEDLKSTVALDQSLAESLRKPYQAGEDLSTRFVQLMQALRGVTGPNLLVIDNATAQLQEAEIFNYLPTPPHWKVLVTSREDLPDFVQLELQVLRPAAALELFRMYYGSGTDEEAMELLEEIGYHTLMIELMAKTLERQGGLLSIPDLLANFRDRELDDPDLEEKLSARHSGTAEKGLFQYLMRLFTLTGLSEEELWVMQQFAVLPPVPIQVELLAEWLKQKPKALNRILNGLADKGWLSRVEEGFVVHRLVQELVKYTQAPGVEELEGLVEAMIEKMDKGVYGNQVTDTFPWKLYAEKVAAYFANYAILPIKISELWNNLAVVIKDSGDYERAAQIFEKVLISDIHNFGPEHPEVASSQANLAIMHRLLGNYTRAKELHQSTLENALEHFGGHHPIVAQRLSNLALAYKDLGEPSRAIELLERALEIDLNHFGSKHPEVAIKRSNLALVLADLQEYERAAILLELALDSDLMNFGMNHPTAAETQYNLAMAYNDLRRFKEAKALLIQALQTFESSLGKEHPHTIRVEMHLQTVRDSMQNAKL